MNLFFRLSIICLISLSFNIHASDLEKEKRWADQVVDAIFDGEPVWLNDGTSKFLGIYTEANNNKKRAAIIMHGTGIHPDWQQVIQPLRVGLTEHNWNTLSIQMPILANDASYQQYAPLYDEVAPRINAAIQYLKQAGLNDIVLIGHSQGATMAAYYLTAAQTHIKGFVAIGMGSFNNDHRMNSVKSLQQILIPTLDLYADDDLENIIKSTRIRADSAKQAGNKQFSQIKIAGNHFFDGHEAKLLKTVAEWLNKTLP